MGNKNKEGGKKAGGEASALGHKNNGGGRKAGGDTSSSAKAGSVSAPSVNFNPKDVTDPYELLDICAAAFHDKYASAAMRESALASLAGALEGVVPLDEAADGWPLVIFVLVLISQRPSDPNRPDGPPRTRALIGGAPARS
jgi:hypothetical protein